MASPNSVTVNYDNIATTTMRLVRRRIADAIFKNNPTIAWFLNKGRVKFESGGKWIEEPVMYQKNSSIQSYRGYDALNVAPSEELTMARFNWRQIAGNVTISGLEELQNDGPAAIFNNFRQKVNILQSSMNEYFDEQMHASQANKDHTRDPLGLDEIIENVTGVSQGTLGGIDKSTYAWWQNQWLRPGTATWTASNGNRELTKQMVAFRNQCSKGISTPDLLVSDQATYEHYENENHDLLRFSPSDRGMMDMGFVGQRFKGIPWFWNENVVVDGTNDRQIYFINSAYMGWTIHKRRNFVMTPFVKPYDRDARVGQLLFAGNMWCNNPRFQGALLLDQITYA